MKERGSLIIKHKVHYLELVRRPHLPITVSTGCPINCGSGGDKHRASPCPSPLALEPRKQLSQKKKIDDKKEKKILPSSFV